MKNRVKILREGKNLTQNELAEKSGLSLRTVQRVEAGNNPKGFTLKAIANALQTEPENLLKKDNIKTDRAKLINLSALLGLVVPFGGIIFPLILTSRTKDPENKKLGKDIVSIQIILSMIFSFSMILSPFLQKVFSLDFPLFIIPLLTFICLKLCVVIVNGISLNRNSRLYISLKVNFL